MYELWRVVENYPLFLLEKDSNFDTIYKHYLEKRASTPCVITLENGDFLEISENSDGDKTVYSRKFGDHKNKKLIRVSNE